MQMRWQLEMFVAAIVLTTSCADPDEPARTGAQASDEEGAGSWEDTGFFTPQDVPTTVSDEQDTDSWEPLADTTSGEVGVAPLAIVAVSGKAGYVPFEVVFDGSGSRDGAGAIAIYEWDFDGDGKVDSNQAKTSHVFTAGGDYEATLTVTSGASSDKASVVIHVLEYAPQVLFSEHFDTDPFGSGRWAVYKDDCVSDKSGTAPWKKDEDGCDGVGGYVERDNAGGRCLQYEGPAFTTAGYSNLSLEYSYRLDGGGVSAALLADGAWTGKLAKVSGSAMADWATQKSSLQGLVSGLRLYLEGGSNAARRLDCVELRGELACKPPVAFYLHPVSQHVCPGGKVTLETIATGKSLTYQWEKDGVALADGPGIAGASGPVLALEGLVAEDSGSYVCRIQGSCGEAQSKPALVTAGNAPVVTKPPQSQDVCQHWPVEITAGAQGAGAVSYLWEKDGVPLANEGGIAGAKSATLTIAAFGKKDEGQYACRITDACGATVSEPGMLSLRKWDAQVPLPAAEDLDQTVPVALPYTEDWVLQANLEGCHAGHFDRYLQGKEGGQLDLLVHAGNDTLCLRLANQRIWWMSATVGGGNFYPEWLKDHLAFSIQDLPVQSGDHSVRIEYRSYPGTDDGNCTMYWDGALVGDWEFWREKMPTPMTQLRVGHIQGGMLRYMVGCGQ